MLLPRMQLERRKTLSDDAQRKVSSLKSLAQPLVSEPPTKKQCAIKAPKSSVLVKKSQFRLVNHRLLSYPLLFPQPRQAQRPESAQLSLGD